MRLFELEHQKQLENSSGVYGNNTYDRDIDMFTKTSRIPHKRISEDAETDKEMYNKSVKAWNDFMNQIKNDIEDFEPYEKTFSDIMDEILSKSYILKYDKNVIVIKFVDEYTDKKGTYHNKITGGGEIVYNEINLFHKRTSSFEKEISNKSDFISILTKKYKPVFIHEFTHFLDLIRSKNRIKYTKSKKKASEYVNSPHEFNAYYHKLLDEINNNIPYKKLYYNANNKNFKEFLNFLEYPGRGINVPTFNNLHFEFNDKYKRHLYKRLYQYYKKLQEQK